MKGTIFEKSRTSLRLWFYAIYLMTSTRCGISARQLARELGVDYKTAARMVRRIKENLMPDSITRGSPAGTRSSGPLLAVPPARTEQTAPQR
jgi:predicted DNA-binding transcriptional regulator YafY